jgi:hypothetical protein
MGDVGVSDVYAAFIFKVEMKVGEFLCIQEILFRQTTGGWELMPHLCP